MFIVCVCLGRHPRAAPDPEPLFDALIPQCAGPEVLPGGPERQSGRPGTMRTHCGVLGYLYFTM